MQPAYKCDLIRERSIVQGSLCGDAQNYSIAIQAVCVRVAQVALRLRLSYTSAQISHVCRLYFWPVLLKKKPDLWQTRKQSSAEGHVVW